MQNLPESVKKELIEFLSEIPVEDYSKDWQAIQLAISMIITPSSFKKGVHVYLDSRYEARESGAYDISDMSIKIWPHKIQIRRKHHEYVSGTDTNINETYRYIYPSERYGEYEFQEVMSHTGGLFCDNSSQYDSDYCGYYSISESFHIETNIK